MHLFYIRWLIKPRRDKKVTFSAISDQKYTLIIIITIIIIIASVIDIWKDNDIQLTF